MEICLPANHQYNCWDPLPEGKWVNCWCSCFCLGNQQSLSRGDPRVCFHCPTRKEVCIGLPTYILPDSMQMKMQIIGLKIVGSRICQCKGGRKDNYPAWVKSDWLSLRQIDPFVSGAIRLSIFLDDTGHGVLKCHTFLIKTPEQNFLLWPKTAFYFTWLLEPNWVLQCIQSWLLLWVLGRKLMGPTRALAIWEWS